MHLHFKFKTLLKMKLLDQKKQEIFFIKNRTAFQKHYTKFLSPVYSSGCLNLIQILCHTHCKIKIGTTTHKENEVHKG